MDVATGAVTPELDELLNRENARQVLNGSAPLGMPALNGAGILGEPADMSHPNHIGVEVGLKRSITTTPDNDFPVQVDVGGVDFVGELIPGRKWMEHVAPQR